jgi:mRNA interferase MazF
LVIKRGEVWWASLGAPEGSGPGYTRPVVVIQSNPFNDSRINTVIICAISSNLKLARAPGNLKLQKSKSLGLTKDSVLNVSQIYTIDKSFLTRKIGRLSPAQISDLNEGLKLVLSV